jgi:DNA replication protein DnaC
MTPAILAIAPSALDLERLLATLNLANSRKTWADLARRAEAENWSYRDFLAIVCAEEMSHRRQTRMQKDTRHAGFPFLNTIEDFDFTLQSSLRLSLLGSYLGPELVSEGRNLILQGRAGRGKTHLAVAIGYRAIQNGFTVRFVTAAELIDDLSEASREGKLRAALVADTQPHVLIIDEVGYLTYGNDAANVLFHVVNDRHSRRRPILFTTNKSPLTQWGTSSTTATSPRPSSTAPSSGDAPSSWTVPAPAPSTSTSTPRPAQVMLPNRPELQERPR